MAVNPDTNYFFFENREALVLAGGGARAAYQVGVLRAICEWLPKNAPWVHDFIAECEAMTADDSHDHDDQVDPMLDAIDDMLAKAGRSWSTTDYGGTES